MISYKNVLLKMPFYPSNSREVLLFFSPTRSMICCQEWECTRLIVVKLGHTGLVPFVDKFGTGCREVPLEYGFEVLVWSEQHTVCFFMCNCVILSSAPSVQIQKHGWLGETTQSCVTMEINFILSRMTKVINKGTFPASRTLFISFSPEWGGTTRLGYNNVLVVREIECGDWLAREYMPAHQQCGLFHPLDCGL